ncbi:hypothetical protein K2Q16_01815 [Patescibacteria group bacterium]|nr:hypothetical protein [Patescibacteria group bacterium]
MDIPLSPLLLLSLLVFILHITGYIVYAINTLREDIKPNAASWLMWMFGGVIEYATYEAIDSETWFSSSLPIACLIGLTMIFIATVVVQVRHRLSGNGNTVTFHKPQTLDYGLMSFDASAGLIWYFLHLPTLANMLAVSSSVVTFFPIWRTTLRTGQEKPAPWIFWCLAYLGMATIVFFEGGQAILNQLFYPLYYLLLHIGVLILCYPSCRSWIQTQIHKIYFTPLQT